MIKVKWNLQDSVLIGTPLCLHCQPSLPPCHHTQAEAQEPATTVSKTEAGSNDMTECPHEDVMLVMETQGILLVVREKSCESMDCNPGIPAEFSNPVISGLTIPRLWKSLINESE